MDVAAVLVVKLLFSVFLRTILFHIAATFPNLFSQRAKPKRAEIFYVVLTNNFDLCAGRVEKQITPSMQTKNLKNNVFKTRR